jgi:hypothetical protein
MSLRNDLHKLIGRKTSWGKNELIKAIDGLFIYLGGVNVDIDKRPLVYRAVNERNKCSGEARAASPFPEDGCVYPGDPDHCEACLTSTEAKGFGRTDPKREGTVYCDGCRREIDLDTCYCGAPINGHSTYNHAPNPAGCSCIDNIHSIEKR